jgi:hypothetical protein
MIHYDPLKDRSEESGWRKVCDEHVPTDEEQDRWGKITFVVTVCLAAWSLLILIPD